MRKPLNLWQDLATSLHVNQFADSVYRDLEGRYTSGGRRYHSIGHVIECVEHLHAVSGPTTQPYGLVPLSPADSPLIELALWFHDAVYDAEAHDNEARSADLAEARCRQMGLGDGAAAAVAGLVRCTAHLAPTAASRGNPSAGASLIRDIDLAILGASPAAYRSYEEGVRFEYAHLSRQEFRVGRRDVCVRLLSRESIYDTQYFRGIFDARARANLRYSLRRLSDDR